MRIRANNCGDNTMTDQELRKRIAKLVSEFHKVRTSETKFIPGKTPVRYAGRIFDEKEIQRLFD